MDGATTNAAHDRENHEPSQRWLRFERPLPIVVFVVCLILAVVTALFQYTTNRSDRSQALRRATDAVAGASEAAAGRAQALNAPLSDIASRLTGLDAGTTASDQLEAVGDVELPGYIGVYVRSPSASIASPDQELAGVIAERPDLDTQLQQAVTAEMADLASGEPTMLDLGTITTLVVHTPTALPGTMWSAALFETELLLGSLSETESGQQVEASFGDHDNPVSAAGPEERSGVVTDQSSVTVLGRPIDITTVGNPPLGRESSFFNHWPTLALGLMIGLAGLGTARKLIRSERSAQRATVRALEAQQAIDRRFRTSFERSPIGIAEIDREGHLVEVNPALCRQVGRSRDKLLGEPVGTIVHPADRAGHNGKVMSVAGGAIEAARSEHRYAHPDGTTVWVDESLSLFTDARGTVKLLLQSQDITARRLATSELAHQAFHDDLTGLPNRALFLNRLRLALDRIGRVPGHVAVMFVDIDRFKVINDSLGHEVGDRLLQEIASRLTAAVRQGDTVARFGGDEFVVLCESLVSPAEAMAVASRIQTSLAASYPIADTPLAGASASIGITLTNDGGSSADELLRDADAAMYRAKETGRNRVELFDASLRRQVVARLEIEGQLKHALENGEMVMHYQAIVDADTELPAGYEALIRWNHPEKGLLGPGAFLPVAEEAGVMHLIDAFALRTACNQIATWSAKHPGFRRMYISTNWSAHRLVQYVQMTEQVLSETSIDPGQLVVEVTEGFLLEDSVLALDALSRLKSLGVKIAIDDFGTGYSSLSYLTRLDVDYLKIDRSFVIGLPDDGAAAIIGAIADMASRLNIGLIAEGVETDEQLEYLRRLGKPRLQGYRFSKPRWAHEVDETLTRRFELQAAVTTATLN